MVWGERRASAAPEDLSGYDPVDADWAAGFGQLEGGDSVTLDSYDFKSFGYPRMIVDAK